MNWDYSRVETREPDAIRIHPTGEPGIVQVLRLWVNKANGNTLSSILAVIDEDAYNHAHRN